RSATCDRTASRGRTAGCDRTATTCARSAGTTTTTGSTTRTASSATTATCTGGYREATQITLTHGSVPGRLDSAVFVVGRIRDPIVDDDIGIGATAERA